MSLNLVQMRENADQNNSEYGHFSQSDSNMGASVFISELSKTATSPW